MAKIEDGGPVLPMPRGLDEEWYSGLSLRDHFASQALAGLTTSRDLLEAGDVARWSYEYADAMLRARAAKAEG